MAVYAQKGQYIQFLIEQTYFLFNFIYCKPSLAGASAFVGSNPVTIRAGWSKPGKSAVVTTT
jgi:hypothetical protein